MATVNARRIAFADSTRDENASVMLNAKLSSGGTFQQQLPLATPGAGVKGFKPSGLAGLKGGLRTTPAKTPAQGKTLGPCKDAVREGGARPAAGGQKNASTRKALRNITNATPLGAGSRHGGQGTGGMRPGLSVGKGLKVAGALGIRMERMEGSTMKKKSQASINLGIRDSPSPGNMLEPSDIRTLLSAAAPTHEDAAAPAEDFKLPGPTRPAPEDTASGGYTERDVLEATATSRALEKASKFAEEDDDIECMGMTGDELEAILQARDDEEIKARVAMVANLNMNFTDLGALFDAALKKENVSAVGCFEPVSFPSPPRYAMPEPLSIWFDDDDDDDHVSAIGLGSFSLPGTPVLVSNEW